jgi:hypothetical protein
MQSHVLKLVRKKILPVSSISSIASEYIGRYMATSVLPRPGDEYQRGLFARHIALASLG